MSRGRIPSLRISPPHGPRLPHHAPLNDSMHGHNSHAGGAIEQMTRVMAKDLAAMGIYVNVVAPGPTGNDLFYKGKTEQVVKK